MNEGNSKEKDDQGKDPEVCDATEVDAIDVAGYQRISNLPKTGKQGRTNDESRRITSAFDIP
jgi:hypothetical protein